MKKMKQGLAVLLAMVILGSAFVFTSSAVTLVWPVPGHTPPSSLSQGFHSGNAIDISDGNIAGATVVAAIGGTVKIKQTCTQQHYGSEGDCGGFGTGLIILGDDNRQYVYAHMQGGSIPSNVYVGARVNAGQTIGRVGTTGNSSDYHLHFGILNASGYAANINPQNETYSYSDESSVDLGSGFYAFIIKLNTWKHLENANNNLQLAASVERDPKQIWLFTKDANGSYEIKSTYNNKCIDVQYGGTTAGTNVWLYEDNDTASQRWYIKQNGSGYYLQPANCQLVMDASGNGDAAGTNIQLWTKSDSSAQRFSVYPLTKDGPDHAYNKPAKPVESVVSVTALGLPNQTTTLSWTASPLKDQFLDAREYTLTLKKDGADYLTKANLETTSMNLTLPAGTYTAQVRAINTKYESYYTDGTPVSFVVKNCSHVWNNGTETKAATCTEAGERTYTCTVSGCGASKTEPIPALNHTAPDGNGNCTRCGTHIKDVAQPTNPTQPTSQQQQQQSGSCKYCGQNHTGFPGVLIGFFHSILALFGLKKK